jgi:hypothetical protein
LSRHQGRWSPITPGHSRAGLTALAAAGLLAGCGSSSSGAADATGPDEAARLEAHVRAALTGVIPNPDAARFSRLRDGVRGAICGEVEVGRPRTLHPFIVVPDGTALVSPSPTLRIDDAGNRFADLYVRYCATVEEMARMAESQNDLGPAAEIAPPGAEAVPVPPAAPFDDDALMPVPEDLPSEPQDPDRSRDPEPPRRGDDDSFFNAIVRPPR